jgi:hypothetical protein
MVGVLKMSQCSSTLPFHASTAELHPVLQAALDSLDVELEEELVRYRRQRYRQARQAEPEQIPVWQPPIARMPSNANPQAPQLPFTSGTSVQNVISRLQQNAITPDHPPSTVAASHPVAEAPPPIAPPSVDLSAGLEEAVLFPHPAMPIGLTHLPPQSPNSGGLQSSSPQSWGARGAKKAELRKSWPNVQGGLSLATVPSDPEWEELIQEAVGPEAVTALPELEFATESASVAPDQFDSEQFDSEQFGSDFDAATDDYLRSSEELLRSIAEEPARRQSQPETNLLDSLLTPLGVGSMALVLLSSATLGYVIMHPSSLDFLWSSESVSRDESASNSSETFASPLIPDSPNLAADEFVDLNVNNLSTLPGTPDRSPLPASGSVSPTLTAPSGATPTALDAVPVNPAAVSQVPVEPEAFSAAPDPLPVAPPTVDPAPAPTDVAPEPPIVESAPAAPIAASPAEAPAPTEAEVATAPVYQNPIDPSEATGTTQSAGTYYVVIPYSGDPSLQQAREAVPDAYVRNFATGASVQLGVFSDQENAQELLQQLEAAGIPAEIYQP